MTYDRDSEQAALAVSMNGTGGAASPSTGRTDGARALPFDLSVLREGRAALWRPAYIATSPELPQVPVLFWIMEALRPRSVAQIGLGDGVAFLALCEAADRLDCGTFCHGVGRDGDGAHLPVAASEHWASHHAERSVLRSDDPVQASRDVRAGEVDLLVLHSPSDDLEQARALAAAWRPALSRKAALVILNPEGVAKDILDVFAPDRPFVSLRSAGGEVAVALTGDDVPGTLRSAVEASPDSSEGLALQGIFARLGRSLSDGLAARASAEALRRAEEELASLRRTLAEQADGLAARVGQIERALGGTASAGAPAMRSSAAFGAAGQGPLPQRQNLQAEYEERLTDIAFLIHAFEANSVQSPAVRKLLKQRDDEIAQLRAERGALQRLEGEMAWLRADRDRLRRQRDVLMSSKSWKMTAPLRAALRAIKGQRPG